MEKKKAITRNYSSSLQMTRVVYFTSWIVISNLLSIFNSWLVMVLNTFFPSRTPRKPFILTCYSNMDFGSRRNFIFVDRYLDCFIFYSIRFYMNSIILCIVLVMWLCICWSTTLLVVVYMWLFLQEVFDVLLLIVCCLFLHPWVVVL